MATLAGLADNVDMDDEVKAMMGNEAEMNKFIPTAHNNECSFYDLMQFGFLLLFERGAFHKHGCHNLRFN
jgi:hypothetical protein